MNHPTRRNLIRAALVAFLALDLLGLVALLYDQLFSVQAPFLWVVSATLVVIAMPLLVRLADAVIEMATDQATIPNPGEKIP